ncbi:hypothetical protein BDF19DRAFT_434182 [Syncephalis fuscata]|nr:hypothetical protein BDF19DRAFT_434182 [Syncephalis fuscata]
MHHTYSFPSRHLSHSFFLFLTVIMMVSRYTICTSHFTQPVCMLVIYSICIFIVAYTYHLMHCIALSSTIAIE